MNPRLGCLALCLLSLASSRGENPNDAAAREGRLAKGVYQVSKQEFVLFSSKDKPKERLALRFTSFLKGKATYQWLYFNPRTNDWVSGAGRLQEVYDKVQTGERGAEVITVPGHNTKIQAGAIGVEWSRGNDKSAWLYFRPEHLKLESFPVDQFRKVVEREPQ